MGLVGVLALDFAGDCAGLVLGASDTESDVVGGDGLDLDGRPVEGEVLGQEVARGFTEILRVASTNVRYMRLNALNEKDYLPGWGYRLRERHV